MLDSIRLLAERLRAGDDEAFDEIVRRCSGLVYNTAYSVLGNAEDAREVSQEVFVSLLKNRAEIKKPEALLGLLKSAARNKALDVFRHKKLGGVSLDAFEGYERPNDDPDPGGLAEDVERNRELSSHLRQAISSLPEDQQETIRLRYELGMSYADIAAYLGVKLDVVRGRLFRAHKALSGLMSPLMKDERL